MRRLRAAYGRITDLKDGGAAGVARTFLSAGAGDFPVASSGVVGQVEFWNTGQECLRYIPSAFPHKYNLASEI